MKLTDEIVERTIDQMLIDAKEKRNLRRRYDAGDAEAVATVIHRRKIALFVGTTEGLRQQRGKRVR